MKRKTPGVLVFALCLMLGTTAAMAQTDPLTGTWTGSYGPNANHQNAVTVNLEWDGEALTGVVVQGENRVPLTEATFNPADNSVRMEASATGFRGEVNYTIEGTLDGNTLTGSWSHERTSDGSFMLTRE